VQMQTCNHSIGTAGLFFTQVRRRSCACTWPAKCFSGVSKLNRRSKQTFRSSDVSCGHTTPLELFSCSIQLSGSLTTKCALSAANPGAIAREPLLRKTILLTSAPASPS
jgi:hypothetical protein